jgi:hypothetical protein
VPFWSPTFSVTEDRFTEAELDAEGLVVLAAEAPVLEEEDEQPAAASPARASVTAA